MANVLQPPPGTRDFYPEEMALRRYIEDTWRRVSLRHGFVEIDGPTFEYLDLYKVKSGDEIVGQLFHFESRGEDKTEFALRPEFTPTLARMVAARANSLPRPIKWFSIPRCYCAERPQKGRLREFIQWNADIIGGDTFEQRRQYDLEVVACCLDCYRELGLSSDDIQLLWNDRGLIDSFLALAGFQKEQMGFAYYFLDRLTKLSAQQLQQLCDDNPSLQPHQREFLNRIAAGQNPLDKEFWHNLPPGNVDEYTVAFNNSKARVETGLAVMGLSSYARYDASIVRGLAYYTGFVWEISDAKAESRALVGGGRYDKLIEMFGGPPLPATGFGAGDVTLCDLLRELKKLPERLAFSPDVFVINALATDEEAIRLLGQLRTEKLAAISSYKTTKNIGKLLQEASASGARVAVILAPAEWEKGVVKIKNLSTRDEKEVPRDQILAAVKSI